MADAETSPVTAAALRAIEAAGGGAALAKRIGVTRFAVQQWKDTGIPAGRVGKVSAATGIPLHELRPDLFPRAAEVAA
ncbi:helix-turn-helix domain-containing protein [Roseomonas sp. NAR14]|uniref:Helix-turn-helix domain-containing protein n=1 Tax=Roseomonas acroporae TaxID=2937791 RepID=A0A9X1YCD0_9PROT|nr:YdaS family helix-turn-helix protein [Roseomonas acroporae]MCK8788194.1 helix-turn-helix domain-containing protein [Roseomonas acroporae]